jgi:hypothetical protein
MKKSNLTLIYAILCLFFPAIFVLALKVFGGPKTVNSDGVDYGALYGLVMMVLGSVFIAIVGSILSYIGYLKNKPDFILYAMILTLVTVMMFITYPLFMLLPILLGVFGFFSWKDVKRLTQAQAETSPKEE